MARKKQGTDEGLPRLYTRKAPLKLPVSVLADAFVVLHGAGEHAAFVDACAKRNLSLNVDPEIINLFKQHVVDRQLHTRDAAADRFVKSTDPRCSADG